MMTLKELYEKITPDNFIVDGDNIYFYGMNRNYNDIEYLCKVKMQYEKTYCIKKSGKIVFLSSEEHMNDYIQRKNNGIRGYKTIKIGYIENYCYFDSIELDIIGADGKHFWWRSNDVIAPKIPDIRKYIRDMTTEFIQVA